MMNKIQTKEEYRLIKRLESDLGYVQSTLSKIQEVIPGVIGVDEFQTAVNKIQDQCLEAKNVYDKSKINTYLGLVKKDNIILIHTTDGISYSEDQYYLILEDISDTRSTIMAGLVKVGHGDSGSWISYDDRYPIELDKLLGLLKTFRHELSSKEVMNKYIEFTKTIPE